MEALNHSNNGGKLIGISNCALSGALGVVTLVTFRTERFLNESGGQSLGNIPAVVMGLVAIIVGVGAFYSST